MPAQMSEYPDNLNRSCKMLQLMQFWWQTGAYSNLANRQNT